MNFGLETGVLLNKTLNSSHNIYCEYSPEDPSCWYEAAPLDFKLTPGKVVSAIAIAILIVVALSGNMLVCTAFFVYQRLRKTTNYFIISLALSDILVAAVSMPIWLSYVVTGWQTLPLWIDFVTLHRFLHWFDILAGVSSITNLTAISIDRCLSIKMPLLHRTRMTNTIAVIIVLFAWIYSIILASISLVQFHYYTAIVASLGFFIPLAIIIVSYSMIYFQVKSGGYSDQDWNLERTLIIVISVFVICWLPFFMFAIIYNYCFSCTFNDADLPYIINFTKWMHYLNSCCNPFIYGLFNLNFKNAFRALLRHCFVLRSSDNDGATRARNGDKTTIKCQIMGLKRSLQLKRKGRGGSFLSSDDADNASTYVTVSSSPNIKLCSEPRHTVKNGMDLHNSTVSRGNAEFINEPINPEMNSDNSSDLPSSPLYCLESEEDSVNRSFLQSEDSQESCV